MSGASITHEHLDTGQKSVERNNTNNTVHKGFLLLDFFLIKNQSIGYEEALDQKVLTKKV